MKWLNDYVDVSDVDIKEFCDKMTMSGSKVEAVKFEGEELENVVVGKIVSISKHPDADKLLVCKTDVAKESLIQVVTAAQNVFEGALVPVALHKSKIAGGVSIKKGKLRGVMSEGMFCSVTELGLTTNDFPEAVTDGIFIIEDCCQIGEDIKSALGIDDVIVDFEITPNRPDCLSVIGLAREVSAVFNRPLKYYNNFEIEDHKINSDLLEVSVEEQELCKRYMAKIAKEVKIGPSPRWMRERLRSGGIRPINNIVDITNYVMLEYGQPIHAFDKEQICDNHLFVRRARNHENLSLLDETERKLDQNVLVVADGKKPLAVAGVMGGESSGISSHTKEVVFEVAEFDRELVRQMSKQLAVRTESSVRFEKGIDREFMPVVLNRICELITQLDIAKIEPGLIDINSVDEVMKHSCHKIKMDYDFINDILGLNLTKGDIDGVLSKLEIKVVDDVALVPSWRPDLIEKADLAEEVCRLYGYDKVKSKKFDRAINSVAMRAMRQNFDYKLMDFVVSQGYHEIRTFSFISPRYYDKINLDENNKLRDGVKILNPLGEDTSVMRTTAIPSMLEVVSKNFNNQNVSGRFFEIAKEYLKNQYSANSSENRENKQACFENDKLVMCAYGKHVTFYDLKRDIINLFDIISLKDYKFIIQSGNGIYHPGRCADIFVGDVNVGVIGEVHPLVINNYRIAANVVVADLDINRLFENKLNEKQYKQISKFPSVTRDLSLICDKDLSAYVIENLIKDVITDNLDEISLSDVYTGEQIESDKKSVCFSLKLRSFEKTLTENDIDVIINKTLNKLEKIGVYIRQV